MCIYAHIMRLYAHLCYIYLADNLSRVTYDGVIAKISDNVTTVSASFKNFSNQIGTSLMTPKIEPTTQLVPPIPLAAPYNPSDHLAPSAQGIYFTREPPPQLAREQFPNVRNWFASEYNKKRRSGKKGRAIDPEESDESGPQMSVLSSYGVDEDGIPVSKTTMDAAREEARAFFLLLLERKRAPKVWGDAPVDIKNELLYRLETSFPFLRYCDNHWKAKKVATNGYSQWRGSLVKKAGKKKAIVAIDIDKDMPAETSKRPSKRPQEEEEDASGPSKRPRNNTTQPAANSRSRYTTTSKQHQKVNDLF
jgi:hypothetical protein